MKNMQVVFQSDFKLFTTIAHKSITAKVRHLYSPIQITWLWYYASL